MSPTETDIADNPDALKAFIADMQAKLEASERARLASEQALAAEQEAHDATRRQVEAAQNAIKLTTLEIEKLKVQLARLRRMKFGRSSERLTMLADQLELTLEDMEAAAGHAHCVVGDVTLPEPAEASRRKPKRDPLPTHLPRNEIVHPALQADGCIACGGKMSALGEDVTEVLEYVPGRFRVVRHVRPKLACDRCDVISQVPAPSLPVPRGRAGPGLLAHVAVSKFADHLPLYRQSRIFAREGMNISRSTLADWLGQVSWLLDPLVERIAAHVMASAKIHADDTPVPVLAPGSGKTKTGRLWIYLRDNRRWSPSDRPAALYRYSPDRKGERPRDHLRTFSGFLQADAYAGFDQLYEPGRSAGQITPVACWAHARRKLHEVFEADRTSVAREGLEIIRDLYEVERCMTPGPTPHPDRCRARKWSRLRALDFFAWADGVLSQISARTPLAAALRYAVKLKPALLAYTTDGRLEVNNNPAENGLRAVALGRRNWTFAGADCGGERAAAMYTLLETCRLNAVNPQEWLADVLERIGQGHPVNRLDELFPWQWSVGRSSEIR